MKKNIGKIDRLLRLVIGVVLIIISIVSRSPVLAIFGIFSIYESLASWCVFYQLLGRNTCSIAGSSPTSHFDFLAYYISGICILGFAILINLFAKYLDWFTWYDIISKQNTPALNSISLDNWLFLLVIYPLSLAVVGIGSFKK